MAGTGEENLNLAPRQQNESPEAKRSKPWENSGTGEEAPEVNNRRIQRELMAAAAEKRLAAMVKNVVVPVKDVKMVEKCDLVLVKNVETVKDVKMMEKSDSVPVENVDTVDDVKLMEKSDSVPVENVERVMVRGKSVDLEKGGGRSGVSGEVLSVLEADDLFLMIFGNRVSKAVLGQWCNQGIRFSADPETSMGLVQHEGGPCGVLAAIQAFVLKYLLFSSEDSDKAANISRLDSNRSVTADIFSSLTGVIKSRALVESMSEILFLCGNNERALIASLDILDTDFAQSLNGSEDEVIAKALGGLSIESGSDFQKVLRVETCTSRLSALQKLESMLPIFRSRMGALIFLISALLSRGLDKVQEDRDDPSQPLVTAPFGHASQEIVNLLLSGNAVANVFDGNMDLGGGMFVKGISKTVEVGFLTLLESLNYCKVGQYLKCPKWPIWVVGSESHYTVLFALDTEVQEENELESRESQIRRAFDGQDQSGGGGFISVEGFHKVVNETGIRFTKAKTDYLCGNGFIVWSEFWQGVLDLEKSFGGVKDSSGLMGKKVFDVYHFNGIAKSVANFGFSPFGGNESLVQKPRLTKLRVSVPPRWTPEEFMVNVQVASSSGTSVEESKPQHAPLVDCVRTRWARAVCNWDGDAPSIV